MQHRGESSNRSQQDSERVARALDVIIDHLLADGITEDIPQGGNGKAEGKKEASRVAELEGFPLPSS